MFLACSNTRGQTVEPEKQVTSNVQSWFSFNSTYRFTDKWGLAADVHVRLDDFVTDNYFYFLRAGAMYWISGKYPVVLGYAHMWLAPPDGDSTWSNENRIYQQWASTQKLGKVSVLNRIRLEERWKDNIVNDEIVGSKLFTVRLRYLASFEFQLFKNPKIPSLVIADEIHIQFGESVIYNTFDQNRIFFGIKQKINKNLSFDIGYWNIWQQKSSGNIYTQSHLLRLFFYYNLDCRKEPQESRINDP
jgi:hypothetical protein